jgi:hypothetical protein
MLSEFITRYLPDGAEIEPRWITADDSFPAQWDGFVTDESKSVALLCPRRSGKTGGIIVKCQKLLTTRPGYRILYIHHTRLTAKQQLYEPMLDGGPGSVGLAERGFEVKRNDTELWVKVKKTGAFFQAVGCDDIRDVGKKLGYLWDLIIIDESQEYENTLLDKLVTKTILPTLIDRNGILVLAGTPPEVAAGVFWDVLHSSEWKQIRWGILDNPTIKKKSIIEVMGKRGFVIDFENPENNHVIIQREIFGLLTTDKSKLVFEYDEERNSIPPGFVIDPSDWRWCFSMGVDLGFSDNDAIVVLGWRTDDPEHKIYECYSWQQNHLDVDQLAVVFLDACKRWRPGRIVGDTGGHGATKTIMSLETRLGSTRIERKPASVLDSVALVNDDLRSGRMKWNPQGEIASDAKKVTWKDKAKAIESSVFHSDLLPAMRYAHSCASHFTGKAPPPKKTQDQLDYEHLRRKQQAQRNFIYGGM